MVISIASASEHQQPKPSILIVDDDKSLLETFRKFFEIKKFDVDSACTGGEAASKIAHRDYDVALIDIFLPDMKGTELLLKFKKTIPGTRKIVVTGYSNVENTIEAVNNGASFFLTKPVRLDKLLEVVNQQLKERVLVLQFCQENGMKLLARS
jgi:two-component system nitrogen regulation response regulator NtrX